MIHIVGGHCGYFCTGSHLYSLWGSSSIKMILFNNDNLFSITRQQYEGNPWHKNSTDTGLKKHKLKSTCTTYKIAGINECITR